MWGGEGDKVLSACLGSVIALSSSVCTLLDGYCVNEVCSVDITDMLC